MLKSIRNLVSLKRSNNTKSNRNKTRSKTKSKTKTSVKKPKCKKIRSKCSVYKKNQCCKTLRCIYPNEKGEGICIPFPF